MGNGRQVLQAQILLQMAVDVLHHTHQQVGVVGRQRRRRLAKIDIVVMPHNFGQHGLQLDLDHQIVTGRAAVQLLADIVKHLCHAQRGGVIAVKQMAKPRTAVKKQLQNAINWLGYEKYELVQKQKQKGMKEDLETLKKYFGEDIKIIEKK